MIDYLLIVPDVERDLTLSRLSVIIQFLEMYSMSRTRETRNHLSLEALLYCVSDGVLAQSAQRLWSLLLVALQKLS